MLKTTLTVFSVLLLCIALSGCGATYIRADNVAENPLPEVAKLLEEEYSVTKVGENRLELCDTWLGWSFYTLGWVTFHANLEYRNKRLYGELYTRQIGLLPPLKYSDLDRPWFGWSDLFHHQVTQQKKELMELLGVQLAEERHTGAFGGFKALGESKEESQPLLGDGHALSP